ncbi:hypothetical protein T552_03293 [Pneumocystis carinii B80]|uniref:Uncharacterized protein n=1 Tax=Pneumocystis carinii (strain B80) TaxID=1408658 RepID=A0A0W4ZC57_PNEC8|nr:hypothetical protein T552_03293 [Pneumocystis carinii B80]KTW26024.1 hypothetical protein T552_03293 [Pneumocystis carinii B80]
MKSLENIVFALHDFEAVNPEDLPLKRGEQIFVLKKDEGFNDGWWEGQNTEGRKGLFPVIYTMSYSELVKVLSVEPLTPKTPIKNAKVDLMKTTISNIDDLLSYIDRNGFKNMSLEDSNVNILNWTPQEVASWIESKGFGSVADKFIEHEITGDILIQMDYSHLREIDIFSFGKRFEIEREIKLLRDSLSIAAEKHINERLKDDTQSSQSMITARNFHSERSDYAQSMRSINSASIKRGSYENSFLHVNNLSVDQSYRSSRNGIPIDEVSVVSKHSLDQPTSIYNHKIEMSNGSECLESLKMHSKDSEATVNSKSSWKVTNKLVRAYKRKSKSYVMVGRLQKIDKGFDHKKAARLSKHMSQDVLKACPYGNYRQMDTITMLKEIQSCNTASSKTFKVEKEALKTPLKKPSKVSIAKKSLLKRDQKVPTAIKEGIRHISVHDAIKEADHYGWMRKKTERYGQWKLRFFCLTGTRLSYFYTEDDIGEKGLIDINSYRVVSVNNRFFYGERKFCFKIIPPVPGTAKGINFTSPKVHYFATDTLEEMKEWVRALIKITIGRDNSVPVLSSCKVPTISLKAAKEKMTANILMNDKSECESLSENASSKITSYQEHPLSSDLINPYHSENLLDHLNPTETSSFISDIKSAWENVEVFANTTQE